jgi:diguanylate cyclase (GGDEF)-like protein
MSLLPTLTSNQPPSSPLSFAGHGGLRAQQRKEDLRLLARREWWLWFSALAITLLSGAAFVLTAFQRFFIYSDHFYEIGPAQARWGVLSLLLLANAWTAYRQWSFRRMRTQISSEEARLQEAEAPQPSGNPSGNDRVTGWCDRTAIELQLGREIALARRQNTPLTLVTLHLNDFDQLTARAGKTATDELAGEFTRRLKESSRGSDFTARIASDDFLLVLPKCSLKEARTVLDRLGVVEVRASGRKLPLAYTSGWVDYQTGDMPSDLLRRATDILQLYKSASNDALSSSLVS